MQNNMSLEGAAYNWLSNIFELHTQAFLHLFIKEYALDSTRNPDML